MADAGRWDSGLKTLPSPQRRSRSRERWDLENSKTLPHRPVSPGPVRAEWHSGLKTLDDSTRRSRSAPRERMETEWQGLGKVVDHSPGHSYHANQSEHWLSENFKVLDAPPKRPSTPERRTPDPRWHSDLDKTLERGRPRRGYRHLHEPRPVRTRPAHSSGNNWLAENFKVLEPNQDYINPKHRFPHDTEWESGFKTVQAAPVGTHEATHDGPSGRNWFYENFKVLDDHGRRNRHLGVVTETGWDSGLYKTLDYPRRHERQDSDYSHWVASGRHLPNKPHPLLRGTERWDKLISTPQSHRGPGGHWAEPTLPLKTLPPEVEYARSHGREYVRHVDMPRRRDMWEFHQRLCHNGTNSHPYSSGASGFDNGYYHHAGVTRYARSTSTASVNGSVGEHAL